MKTEFEQNIEQKTTTTKGSDFRLAMYASTKICMFYSIISGEWLALTGFTIATIYAYIDMMSKD